MATVEMSRVYPVEREKLWHHLTDPTNFPSYYNNLIDVGPGRFSEPGDDVEITYRLLGRDARGTIEIQELEPEERIRIRARVAGLPDVDHQWAYEDQEGSTCVRVTMRTGEVASWLGRSLDRFLIPRQLEKDLERSFDNVDTLVAVDL